MALQLKGSNQDITDSNNNSISTTDESEGKNIDPWGNKDIEDDIYEEKLVKMKYESKVESRKMRRSFLKLVVGVFSVVLLIGLVYFGKKYVAELLNPTITDLTKFANKNEKAISDELGVEFSDTDDWLTYILSWVEVQNKKLEVHANGELGVFYIDGRQSGIFVHAENYEIYNIQVGMGDKKALEQTTYPYKKDDYFVVEEDMNEGKNTTYYYFDKDKNDCIGLTKNDTTQIIEGIIYINNYQLFSKDLRQE